MALRALVDATDINSWSARHDAQRRLPQLVRRLIHATVSHVERIEFPAGEGVQLGGWDGIVTAQMGNAFLPDGLSVWEFSAKRDVKDKADDDYEKRKADPLGLDPSATTFVFVTSRRWGGKSEWIKHRQAERIWRDVRAYDADDLEQWLELAPAVHTWLSIALGKYPDSAVDVEGFWRDWSEATRPALSPSILTNGRREQIDLILAWLRGRPAVLSLQADSRDEAIAFFAAVVHELSDEDRVPVLSRSILVDDKATWYQLTATDSGLLLVPRFDVGDAIARASRGGHHVFMPLGRDDSVSSTALQLPRLRRKDVTEALLSIGVSEELTSELAILARRSLMALRRKLAINREVQRPVWAKPVDARDLLPALLAGGWNDTQPAERDVIENLAGKPYGDVNAKLVRWVNEMDPPVRRVGDTWLLVSKEDAWSLLSRFLSRDDLERFESVVFEVLGAVDPQFDLPTEKRWMAGALGHAPAYSGLLRQGIADTIALMGARSDSTVFADSFSGQERANRLVRHLLDMANSDWRLWASLSSLLRSIAEAAPGEFLAAVERGLVGEHPVLARLFVSTDNSLFDRSPHTGLLWALELLAWHPDYLARVALCLARLAACDPGGKLMNRPDNSLREIFLFWHPQTTASLKQRIEVLDLIRRREPQVAWKLMCRLLPELQSVASPTATPKWREWILEEQSEVVITELIAASHEIVERLLVDVGKSASQWRDLVEHIDDVPREQYDLIIERLETVDLTEIPRDVSRAIRDSSRTMISRHRSFPNAHWRMPEDVINRLGVVYDRFEPDDVVDKHAWLFADRPQLLESFGHDWQARERAVATAQMNAIKQLYQQDRLRSLIAMASVIEAPRALGIALGNTELLTTEEEQILLESLDSDRNSLSMLVRGYVSARARIVGWLWVEEKVASFTTSAFSSKQQSDFFLCLPFEGRSWDLLHGLATDVQKLYWSQTGPWGCSTGDCRRAIDYFLEHSRPYAALELIALHQKEVTLPPVLIADVLEQFVRSTPEENLDPHSIGYHVSDLLGLLEGSGEVPEDRLAGLEWSFLPFLEHQSRGPVILHRELARNPGFFIEILTIVYRGEDDLPRDLTDLEQLRARLASDLLRSWRTVPGTQPDGSIDAMVLREWVTNARNAAKDVGRASVADMHIGEIMACSPKDDDGNWPVSAVCDIIDGNNNENIDRGFVIRVYNSRGTYTKAIAEGGVQERQLMTKYQGYADAIKGRWPHTAVVLRQIADWYATEARREDIRAEFEEDF